jgi:hypothetical protein
MALAAIRLSPSTGSASRDAWRPRTNSGTATAKIEPPRAKAMAASMGVSDRTT